MLKYNDNGMRKFTRNELLKIYSKELRDLTTEIKKESMIEFIKEKIKFSQVKDFIKGSEDSIKYIVELNKISNLDSKLSKEQFELEQVFLYSILHTEGFKKYVLDYFNKEDKKEVVNE